MTRTERTYYVVFGLYNFSWSFIGPMYALFLLARGLDVLQVNLVSATYLISVFLFEVPTGAVADLVGRKASFLLSCAVRAVARVFMIANGLCGGYVAERDLGGCRRGVRSHRLHRRPVDARGGQTAAGAGAGPIAGVYGDGARRLHGGAP